MNAGSSQLSSLLTDTVRMLCQNTVEYCESLRIQGLLVVTADSNHVHVIEISDTFPSPQSTGVGSSGLCETETEVNDYKPPIQMTAQDPPPHSVMSQQEMGHSFHTKATGVRGVFRATKPPVKRRGGFLGFPAASKRSHQRMVPKKPRVKMEDPIIVDDSPDDTVNMAGDMNMIEPKIESGWADPTGDYQNMQEFPEAGDVPGYHGTDMQLYSSSQSSQPRGRRRGRRSAAAAYTVTSSDGVNEQSALAYDEMAQDMKPYHLNYGGEQGDSDGGQSFLSPDFGTDPSLLADPALEGEERDDVSTHVCQYADCGRSFQYKRNLIRHQRQVHGALYGAAQQMSFFCSIQHCRRTFYCKSTLAKHQRTVHGLVTNDTL